MTAPLIGLMGRKRSGKDTFAERLVSAHGFVRVAFADPLRATLYDLDPLVRVEIDEVSLLTGGGDPQDASYWRLAPLVDFIGWERAKELREVRRLMQAHGVAIREHVGESVWVDAAMWEVQSLRDTTPVVVTDVRFPNEAAAVGADGGILIRIERPGQDAGDAHISETALDGYPADFTFVNAGSVEDLHRLADSVLL